MNRSKGFWIVTVTFVLLALAACIQGPWNYYPANPPSFKGIFVTGYAIADRPIENLCFERLLDIKEEQTSAYAFYESADVRLTGKFGDSVSTILMIALPAHPNCFMSDTTKRILRGEHYKLSAKFTWDSAGVKVTSSLTGVAQVPTSFSINRTAAAPALAEFGGLPENITSIQSLNSLPDEAKKVMLAEFGDSLSKYEKDTALGPKYFLANQKKIQDRLLSLLPDSLFTYTEGDPVFYLNGALNTRSHYFSSKRSPDVGAVLITQQFDPTTERPQTRFDAIAGIQPDSDQYYFPGNKRRLLVYPNGRNSNGWSVFDSLGVVNTWFHTGKNHLSFYGMEAAYYSYLATATSIQGGGGDGGDGDSRVKIKYNVEGGQGTFVGGIVDTFNVYIKVDALTKSYSTPAVHAYACREDIGWGGNKDCRAYYRIYCQEKNWQPLDCGLDKIKYLLEQSLKAKIFDSIAVDFIQKIVLKDTSKVALKKEIATAENQVCGEQDFQLPDSTTVNVLAISSSKDSTGKISFDTVATPKINTRNICAEEKIACLETKGINDCKQSLWNFCLDRNWRPTQCNLGLVSYCREKPRLSEILCKNADAYCKEHPTETLCK